MSCPGEKFVKWRIFKLCSCYLTERKAFVLHLLLISVPHLQEGVLKRMSVRTSQRWAANNQLGPHPVSDDHKDVPLRTLKVQHSIKSEREISINCISLYFLSLAYSSRSNTGGNYFCISHLHFPVSVSLPHRKTLFSSSVSLSLFKLYVNSQSS